jgi:hypothetical protein
MVQRRLVLKRQEAAMSYEIRAETEECKLITGVLNGTPLSLLLWAALLLIMR